MWAWTQSGHKLFGGLLPKNVKLKRTEKPFFGRSPGEFLRHLAPDVGESSVNPLNKVLAAVKEVLPSKKATLVVLCVGVLLQLQYVAIFSLFGLVLGIPGPYSWSILLFWLCEVPPTVQDWVFASFARDVHKLMLLGTP